MRRHWRQLLPLMLLAALLGCQPALRSGGQALERGEALQLAVQLANAECRERYHDAPFSEASYPIDWTDGRWTWGGLDLVGEGGFSALVSFDDRGGGRQVEVYFSIDEARPLY